MIKNYKNFIWIGAVVILLVGLIIIARPTPSAPTASVLGKSGALVANEGQYDFGAISMAAGKVSRFFTIKNSGDATVTLNRLYTSCMCTTAALKIGNRSKGPFGMPGHGLSFGFSEALLPNEEAVIEVIFDPAAHGPAGVGRIERVVYLEPSDGAPLELNISANVIP